MKKTRKANTKPLKPGDIIKNGGSEPHHFDKRLWYSILIGAVLILGITFLYPMEKIYMPLDVPNHGDIAAENVRAPFDFPIFKSQDELNRDEQIVLSNLRPVLSFDTLLTQMVAARVNDFTKVIDSATVLNLNKAQKSSVFKSRYPMLPDSIINAILKNPQLVSKSVQSIVDTLLNRGIVNDINTLPLQSSGLVTIISPDRTKTVARDRVYDLPIARMYIANQGSRLAENKPAVAQSVKMIASMFIEANLIFDKQRTEQAREAELKAIPKTKGIVFKDELIIKANERVTEVHRDKLASLAKYKSSRDSGQGWVNYLLPPLGRLFFVAFPILYFVFFLFFFRRRIFNSNIYLLLFAILIGVEVFLLNIVISLDKVSAYFLSIYLVPISVASMLTTILFDEEVGLSFTIAIGLLVGVLTGFKLDIAFVTIITGTVATFSVRRVRHRHEFYRPILYLTIAYVGSVYIIESLKLTAADELVSHVVYALLNGFVSPILTIGLLPLFESGFGITTDVTLLELSDLNRPLLKRLAIEAPGTYQHSIMIGTLAEDAAERIGANSLLARVGSYYHDIGKMLKPEYFVENQTGSINKHEKLAPTMSAMILEAHVKEGVELAREHNLPSSIIEFITGHHGTSVMSFFYEKARNEQGEDDLDVKDFQYPGPNPTSKEVAIVMLADSVEAASRTLDDPKPARIRNLVHRLFMDKLDSGLLENSNLTLRDIKRIEDSFVRVLIAFHHRRIKYPEKKKEVAS